jgi:hypothetical protein
MRVAIVFDTPYSGWDHADHQRQMDLEVAGWDANEPEMARTRSPTPCGSVVTTFGCSASGTISSIWSVVSVSFPLIWIQRSRGLPGDETLEYLLPGLLEAEDYRYTGAPPLALQITRNKAVTKKVLTYYGIQLWSTACSFSVSSTRR